MKLKHFIVFNYQDSQKGYDRHEIIENLGIALSDHTGFPTPSSTLHEQALDVGTIVLLTENKMYYQQKAKCTVNRKQNVPSTENRSTTVLIRESEITIVLSTEMRSTNNVHSTRKTRIISSSSNSHLLCE